MIKSQLTKLFKDKFDQELNIDWSDSNFADFSINPGELNKLSTNQQVADIDNIKQTIEEEFPNVFNSIESKNGFLNFLLSEEYIVTQINKIYESVPAYIKKEELNNKKVIFDYSSPNIAKPFSIGHLRSTIIGQANLNCHKALGYETLGINHIGDWGTQFGKLIVAIKRWGDLKKIETDPINELNSLYVKFHDESKNDKSLEDEAREWFLALEKGDEEAREIWKKCVKWSMEEFDQIYEILNINIDKVLGESFYEDKLDRIIIELQEKNLLKKSKEADIVELEGLPPALIRKSDGATLYLTRDLASLKYRISTFNPEKIIYHVGNEQLLHFKQLIAVATKLGWLKKTRIEFAGHGLLRLPEGKMSTREGRVILLKDLIEKAVGNSKQIIEEKGTHTKDKDELAKKIAISAIKYADLKQNRKSDVIFSFDKAINLSGDSATYLQYAYARLKSIQAEAAKKHQDLEPKAIYHADFVSIYKKLLRLNSVVERSAQLNLPNFICEYAFSLANEFSTLYEKRRIIVEDKVETEANIFVVNLIQKVILQLFEIIGIEPVDSI